MLLKNPKNVLTLFKRYGILNLEKSSTINHYGVRVNSSRFTLFLFLFFWYNINAPYLRKEVNLMVKGTTIMAIIIVLYFVISKNAF